MSRQIPEKHTYKLSKEQTELSTSLDNKLLFTEYQGKNCALYLQGQRLTFAHFFTDSKIGALYIGKVKNVAKNINACFVEIANKEIVFIPMKDVKNPLMINRTYDGRILQGDEILVQVTRDAQKNKQATATAHIEELDRYREKAIHSTCYSCLRRPNSIDYLSVVSQSVCLDTLQEIITDQQERYNQLLKSDDISTHKIPVRYYSDTSFPLHLIYSLKTKMATALDQRIWLKSGGFIVIQSTEAMTVIDVNSGKYEASGRSEEETALYINTEAAEEIALQLKLRNLSGIIVVDFINMKESANNQYLLDYMRQLTAADPVKTLVVDMTRLGLVEITRKKVLKPLSEQLFG